MRLVCRFKPLLGTLFHISQTALPLITAAAARVLYERMSTQSRLITRRFLRFFTHAATMGFMAAPTLTRGLLIHRSSRLRAALVVLAKPRLFISTARSVRIDRPRVNALATNTANASA